VQVSYCTDWSAMQSVVGPPFNGKQPRRVTFEASSSGQDQVQWTEVESLHAHGDSDLDCDYCCGDDEVSLRFEDLESEHESSRPAREHFATFHESRRGGLQPALEIALNKSSSSNMSLHLSSSSMDDSFYPTKPRAATNGRSSYGSPPGFAVDDDETSVTMQCDEDEALDSSERPLIATFLSRC
jgi:hypothetical protein